MPKAEKHKWKDKPGSEFDAEPARNVAMEEFAEEAAGATCLEVNLMSGEISVHGTADKSWSLTWSSRHDVRPEVEREGDTVTITSSDEFGRRLDLKLAVPAHLETVELESAHGRISVEGLNGELTLHSGNGRIELRSVRGEAAIQTGGGDVTITDFEGELEATTGSGDLTLEMIAGEAELATGNGDIKIRYPRSLELEASSARGDLKIEGGSVRNVEFSTTLGDIVYATDLEPGRHELETNSGEITIRVPSSARLRVDAQTSVGQIRSDFPLVRVGRTGPMGFGGGVRMVGSIGEGEPEVDMELRSNRGQIGLRQAREGRPEPRPESVPPVPAFPPAAATFGDLPQPAGPLPGFNEAGNAAAGSADDMMAILEAVARGDISPEEADKLLAGKL